MQYVPSTTCRCHPLHSKVNFTAIARCPHLLKPHRKQKQKQIQNEKKATGHSRLLVKEEDVRASLEESVCGRETGETATNNDDLGHSDMQDVCVGDEG